MKLFSILYIAIKMSQSFSIPDAQPDPFREFFRPDSLSYSQSHSLEISDSQFPEISDSQSLEIPDSQNSESTILTTSRDERIAIQTALLFKIPHARIREELAVTEKQINYARNYQVTPQKSKTGKI